MKPLTPEEWKQVERWAYDDPDLMIARLAAELLRLRSELAKQHLLMGRA